MTSAKTILRLVPTMQAAGIAANAYRGFSKRKKKQNVKGIMKSATGTIVGISFISPTAQLIEGMS